jgi:hypothetical protein
MPIQSLISLDGLAECGMSLMEPVAESVFSHHKIAVFGGVTY